MRSAGWIILAWTLWVRVSDVVVTTPTWVQWGSDYVWHDACDLEATDLRDHIKRMAEIVPEAQQRVHATVCLPTGESPMERGW